MKMILCLLGLSVLFSFLPKTNRFFEGLYFSGAESSASVLGWWPTLVRQSGGLSFAHSQVVVAKSGGVIPLLEHQEGEWLGSILWIYMAVLVLM